MNDVEKRRNRLNTLVLLIPGQWFGLMAFYWLRFLPPVRPFRFETPFPPPILFVCGVLACCVPVFLPRSYFKSFAFERGGLYPWLGIRWFRFLATDGDLVNRALRRLNPDYRVIHNRESLRKHIEGTYTNERWHTAFFIAGALTATHAIYTGQYLIGVLLSIFNIAFNLYPIMHQRHKRARLRLSVSS